MNIQFFDDSISQLTIELVFEQRLDDILNFFTNNNISEIVYILGGLFENGIKHIITDRIGEGFSFKDHEFKFVAVNDKEQIRYKH